MATSQPPEPLELPFVRVWLGEDGINHVVWLSGASGSIAEAEPVAEWLEKAGRVQARPVMADIRSQRSLDRDARLRFASATGLSRVALIVSSPVSRMIANFYLGLSRPSAPTRLFTSEEAARAWLKQEG